MNKIYVVYLEDKPYIELDGKIYFSDEEKAKKYRDNLVRHIGRELYLKFNNEDWYEIGEERKQYWFKEADKKLSVKTYILKEEDELMNKILAIIISILIQCIISCITFILFTNSTDSKFIITYIGGAFAVTIAQIWNEIFIWRDKK